jgi:hypothetical protein
MQAFQRIVTSTPLGELFDEQGTTTHKRTCDLGSREIRTLLRQGRVQFVVVDGGKPPQWIPLSDCFNFFKREVAKHIAEPKQPVCLDDFAEGYFYFASKWVAEDESVAVVLELNH